MSVFMIRVVKFGLDYFVCIISSFSTVSTIQFFILVLFFYQPHLVDASSLSPVTCVLAC